MCRRERDGVGGGGAWEPRQVKASIQTQRAVLYLQHGNKLIQSTREAKTAIMSSFVSHAILLKLPGP